MKQFATWLSRQSPPEGAVSGDALAEGMRYLTTLEEVRTQPVRAFAAYCLGLPKINGMPTMSAFRPFDIPRLAVKMCVLGIVEDGREFECRLVGSEVVQFLGSDPTGRRLSDVLGDDTFSQRTIALVRAVHRSKSMVINQPERCFRVGRTQYAFESLGVPMADEVGEIAKLIFLLHAEGFA